MESSVSYGYLAKKDNLMLLNVELMLNDHFKTLIGRMYRMY